MKRLKTLLASALIGLASLSVVGSANAASGFSMRDGDGNTYTMLRLNTGRMVRLYPTPEACGASGAPYDIMGALINSGRFGAWVDNDCGNLIRVCIRNGATFCSTYARHPVPHYVYDGGF